MLFAQSHLLGIVAAVYHLTNGITTGAEVLGWVSSPVALDRLWRICITAVPALLLAGLAAWYVFAVRWLVRTDPDAGGLDDGVGFLTFS